MKSAEKIFAFVAVVVLSLTNAINAFAIGNPVDSDLSNTAGSNSGKSHFDIYAFIIVLLIICIVVPFFEKKRSRVL